jgi:outer membrane receptor protein involved in Fe transport
VINALSTDNAGMMHLHLDHSIVPSFQAFVGVNDKDDAFEQPFNSLDFTYSYTPTDAMTLKLGLKNLLDEDVEILQQGQILQKRVEGQSYSLSFSYKY